MESTRRGGSQFAFRWRGLTITAVAAFAICASIPQDACAQGGPPMLTDDPDTPGNGKFELNLALAFERRPHEVSGDVPAIDLNYGLGDRIQLTLQTSLAVRKRSSHGPIGGLGRTEVAVKWRFLDEKTAGVSISTFPRVLFNVLQSSVRRGLAEDGTRVQFPLQVARKFGAVDVDFEFGLLPSSVGRSEWLYGIAVGTNVTKKTELMAELHGTARTSFARDLLTVNVGLRQKLSASSTLIASVGHDLRSPDDEPLSLIGYFGVQLLF